MNRRPQKSRSGYDSFSPSQVAHFKVSSPDTRFFESRKKQPVRRIALLSLLALVLLLLLVNLAVNQFVQVRTVTVPVKGLDEAFDGFTILQISDLKGASFGGDQSLFSFAMRNRDFDLVVLTGDMISARGNAQPLYALLEALQTLAPDVPVYFIAGDSDPEPTSMDYAAGGSPFAPWVLGAQQRGAMLLSAPQRIEREEQTLWLTTSAHLSLDIDTMQPQFETGYLRALESGDENEIELATYNLGWLNATREAREAMEEDDVYVTATHVPPTDNDLTGSLTQRIDLLLCGHYLGGLVRLPLAGPVFIPSQSLPLYGLFPGADTYAGLSRRGTTYIHTSTGLGSRDDLYPGFFFRLFNPPSVTLLTLTMSTI